MANFTDEAWAEIEKARERMRAYVNKGRPYPPLPDEALTFEREGQASRTTSTTSPTQQQIDQLKGNLISLRDALKQHVIETKPKVEGHPAF